MKINDTLTGNGLRGVGVAGTDRGLEISVVGVVGRRGYKGWRCVGLYVTRNMGTRPLQYPTP
eukprot:753343-Hanusia_phi.AAC.2